MPSPTAVPWYLDPVLLPALSGFLGVIVGGFLTFISSVYVQWRKERSDRNRTAEERNVRIKTAARLLEIELLRYAADVHGVVEKDVWPGSSLSEYRPGAWSEQIEILAPVLGKLQWDELSAALTAVSGMHNVRQRGIRPDAPREQKVELLKKLHAQITNGQRVLADFIGEWER
jgi:hypothetical protein